MLKREFEIKLHHKIASAFGYDLIRRNNSHDKYEYHLTKLLNLYKIDLVFDVGANIGQFAESLRSSGYQGTIVSFEPTHECFNTIRSKSSQDSNWHVFNIGLGDKEETLSINIPSSTVFSSILKTNDFSQNHFEEHLQDIKKENIEIKRFDDWLKEHPEFLNQKAFLKLDTQGFDLNALRGAKENIPNIYGISTELSFISIYEGAPMFDEVLNYLKENQFSVTGLFPVTRNDKNFQLIEADCVTINNKFLKS